MAVYLLAVYLHMIATVFWVGYILFWVILITPLARQFKPPEITRLLRCVNESSWPSVPLRVHFHFKLHELACYTLLVLFFTGGVILHYRGVTLQSIISGELFLTKFGLVLVAKLILFGGLGIGHFKFVYRPSRRLIYFELLTTLSIVGLAVLLIR
jgi:hypothetical protein